MTRRTDPLKFTAVGGAGVGILFRMDRLPEEGESRNADSVQIVNGGKASNHAVGAAVLGCSSSILTALGDDEFGGAQRRIWSRFGVRDDAVTVKAAATMVGTVLVEHGGNNRVIVAPGALGALTRYDVVRNRAVLTDADVVLISLEIPDDVALAAAEIAHEAGVLTILNPAPAPAIASAEAMCAHVDVITPNRSEAELLGGRGAGAEAIASSLHERFDVVVVMTDGDRGSVIADRGGTRRVPAVQVADVVDTSGAGDAFSTALAVGLAHGLDIKAAAEFATQAAARIVRGPGFVEALDNWKDLERPGPATS